MWVRVREKEKKNKKLNKKNANKVNKLINKCARGLFETKTCVNE
jgi:hypothetical protein